MILVNFCDSRLQNSELKHDRWTQTKISCEQEVGNCYGLSRVS